MSMSGASDPSMAAARMPRSGTGYKLPSVRPSRLCETDPSGRLCLSPARTGVWRDDLTRPERIELIPASWPRPDVALEEVANVWVTLNRCVGSACQHANHRPAFDGEEPVGSRYTKQAPSARRSEARATRACAEARGVRRTCLDVILFHVAIDEECDDPVLRETLANAQRHFEASAAPRGSRSSPPPHGRALVRDALAGLGFRDHRQAERREPAQKDAAELPVAEMADSAIAPRPSAIA